MQREWFNSRDKTDTVALYIYPFILEMHQISQRTFFFIVFAISPAAQTLDD